MRPSALLPLTALFVTTALADVKFSKPAAGATLSAGTISIEWDDSGDTPKLSDLTSYQIQLMQGGNDDSSSVALAVLSAKGAHSAGMAAQGTVDPAVSGNVKNSFYLKMTSVAKEGGQVINFSDRFSITGLTGTAPASVATAMKSVTGTAGPATIDQVSNNAGAAVGADGGSFDVPYADQSGATKYAPMQGIPPTKISAKNFKPLHPTSGYTIATAFLPNAKVQTTITQSQTFHVSSMENTAAPQAGPTDDMQKFLNRWKD
ncbi:hypothetical protein CKM354_000649900 [Cercospora kikuchii]|uniref:Uncharacterized protein n=1 Tax=Cercospora kikuchii TaxID=84275 RepID=A0A9P3CKX0_9PEZI|nr:uncharacterized protein CKM354_000649900 [Cercospora kikuchii]GIZ43267.1 hypothetical protein CKM354_000649900 [Cercospora kikuchii]